MSRRLWGGVNTSGGKFQNVTPGCVSSAAGWRAVARSAMAVRRIRSVVLLSRASIQSVLSLQLTPY
jgi:hypothetical protein